MGYLGLLRKLNKQTNIYFSSYRQYYKVLNEIVKPDISDLKYVCFSKNLEWLQWCEIFLLMKIYQWPWWQGGTHCYTWCLLSCRWPIRINNSFYLTKINNNQQIRVSGNNHENINIINWLLLPISQLPIVWVS